jgi:UrcA family protein
MRKSAFIAWAAVAAFAQPPAAAGTPEVSVRFHYAPEEAATAGGAAALLQRLKLHARNQCRYVSTRALNPKADECADDLVRQFVTSIDQPLLHQAAKKQGNPASEPPQIRSAGIR